MSAHRLPVYRPAALDSEAYQGEPRSLPGRAIAILDPTDGALCLAFAARLSRELMQLGSGVPVALASFESAPTLTAWQRGAFAEGQPLYALSAQADERSIAALLGPAAHGLWVVVGQAALGFATAFSIVVGAEAPVLRWPDALREARGRISLALSSDGLSVASALARELARRSGAAAA